MKCSASVFLGLIFLGILTPADACVLNGPRYQLAADTVRWSLELISGESCTHGVRFNNVAFDKLKVAAAPQTGHVTLHGPGFSYKAASDFQGRDFFSLMVSGTTNKIRGSSTIEVVVSVSRASELRPFPPASPLSSDPPSPTGSATSSPPPPPHPPPTPAPPPPSDLLPADRVTAWNPGLDSIGGIPVRSTICANLIPSGVDDTAEIQAAINACPAGQVVQLTAGTFIINTGNYLRIDKGISLRGAGPGQTILSKTNGATQNSYFPGPNASPLIVVGPARYLSGNGGSTKLTADAVKGANSITVADPAGLSVGKLVLLDEVSGAGWQTDPQGHGQIWAAPDWRVVWQKHNPPLGGDDFGANVYPYTPGSAGQWFSRLDRPTAEWKQIESISGSTVTFTTPIHISYRTSHTAQLTYLVEPHVIGAGIEGLTVRGGDDSNVLFISAAMSWAKNVESTAWLGNGFSFINAFRVELREFYVHDGVWPVPGGGGYAISLSNGTSEMLIENGISVRVNKVIVARSSGAGSVVGYNYMDMGYIGNQDFWIEIGLNGSHMVGPHHMLFEGNYGFNADSDKTHGNSIYHTFFRNHLRGVRAQFTDQLNGTVVNDLARNTGRQRAGGLMAYLRGVRAQFIDQLNGTVVNDSAGNPQRAGGLMAFSYWMSFIGNVLGSPNQMNGWLYEAAFPNSKGVWMLGWDDVSPHPVDAKVAATAIRHGNFDYLTNTVNWDPTITNHTLPNSLYLTQKPAFFNAGSGYTWPWVDPVGTPQLYRLPAKARYDAGTPFTQP
jgi:hypothetical protein